jgi:RNA polymerase sigma-70 factor (ECF subfamily)
MPTPEEERRWVEASRRGDVDAFDRLVRTYERTVYNAALRLTGSADDASDIAQDAFIRAWNNLKSFRGDAKFSTWMHRIVMNAFLDDRKKRRARPTRSLDGGVDGDENSEALQIPDPAMGPEALAESDERRRALEAAVRALPEAQRVLVVLYHNQGLAYEEISEATGLPLGTVKSRLNRARLTLRDRLSRSAELFAEAGRRTL